MAMIKAGPLFSFFFFGFVYSMPLGVKTRLKLPGGANQRQGLQLFGPQNSGTPISVHFQGWPAEIPCVSMGTKNHLDYIIYFNLGTLPRVFFCFVQFLVEYGGQFIRAHY